jgi:hypothetical protein
MDAQPAPGQEIERFRFHASLARQCDTNLLLHSDLSPAILIRLIYTRQIKTPPGGPEGVRLQ